MCTSLYGHFSSHGCFSVQAVAFSHQQMKDKPKGIREFNCHQDIHEPNTFHFWERYDGNRQMGEHNTTEQMQHFMEKASMRSCQVLLRTACEPMTCQAPGNVKTACCQYVADRTDHLRATLTS